MVFLFLYFFFMLLAFEIVFIHSKASWDMFLDKDEDSHQKTISQKVRGNMPRWSMYGLFTYIYNRIQ